MTSWLLDAGVLLALVWPRHEGHHAAHAWFAETGRSGWASNTLTQLGALRLLTHPAVTKGTVSPSEAVRIVDAMTAHPAHEFWSLEDMPLKVWGDILGGFGRGASGPTRGYCSGRSGGMGEWRHSIGE